MVAGYDDEDEMIFILFGVSLWLEDCTKEQSTFITSHHSTTSTLQSAIVALTENDFLGVVVSGRRNEQHPPFEQY